MGKHLIRKHLWRQFSFALCCSVFWFVLFFVFVFVSIPCYAVEAEQKDKPEVGEETEREDGRKPGRETGRETGENRKPAGEAKEKRDGKADGGEGDGRQAGATSDADKGTGAGATSDSYTDTRADKNAGTTATADADANAGEVKEKEKGKGEGNEEAKDKGEVKGNEEVKGKGDAKSKVDHKGKGDAKSKGGSKDKEEDQGKDEYDIGGAGAYSTVVTSGVRPEFVLESPRSVEAISKGEILRGAGRSTPEVLENTPGVVVQKTNHGGGSPFIRGLTGQHVLFLLDGVRLNNSTTRYGPNQMLNTVDPLILTRMEVLRGPGSVLYGSDAMGGVIQLFSRDAPMVPGAGFRWGGEAIVRGSTADRSQVYNVGGWTQYGKVGVSVGGSFKHFNDLTGGRGVGKQDWTGYHEGGWDGAVKVLLGGDWMLKVASISIRQVDVPRTDKCSPMDYRFYSHQDRDLVYAKLTGSHGRLMDRFEAVVSYQRYREVRDRYRLDRGRVETEWDNVHTAGIMVKAGTNLGRYSRLSYGLDLYHDWVYSTAQHEMLGTGEVLVMDGFRGRFVDGSRFLQGGLFLYDEIKLVEWMVIHLGGRIALSYASIPADPLAGEFGFVSEDINKGFVGPIGGGSVTFAPVKGLKLVTSVQQGYRAPNLDDYSHVGSEGPAFDVPSPNIEKAETSTTLEAGAKVAYEGFFASVFGHYSFLRNFIARRYTGEIIDGQPAAVRANAGKGYVAGIEGRLAYRFTREIFAETWISWTRGDIEMEFQEPTTQPIRRMSPLQGAASVSYLRRDKKWAKVVLRWSARQDRLSPGDLNDSRICLDGAEGCTGTPGFAIVSLAGGIPLNSHVDFSLHVHNLTNEKYKYHGSGVYGAGISAIAQLRIKY